MVATVIDTQHILLPLPALLISSSLSDGSTESPIPSPPAQVQELSLLFPFSTFLTNRASKSSNLSHHSLSAMTGCHSVVLSVSSILFTQLQNFAVKNLNGWNHRQHLKLTVYPVTKARLISVTTENMAASCKYTRLNGRWAIMHSKILAGASRHWVQKRILSLCVSFSFLLPFRVFLPLQTRILYGWVLYLRVPSCACLCIMTHRLGTGSQIFTKFDLI